MRVSAFNQTWPPAAVGEGAEPGTGDAVTFFVLSLSSRICDRAADAIPRD